MTTDNGTYPQCEGDHDGPVDATWYATMPLSQSPSALMFLCTPHYVEA